MKIKFTYSFRKEIAEAVNMVLHVNDYKNLRSVVWPLPQNVIGFASGKDDSIGVTAKVWEIVSEQVENTFKKLHLKDLGNVICFVHGISCEGWFDVDDNSIHVRLSNYGSEKNLVDTIVHELLHLATYDKKLTYDEREAIVDNLLAKPEFQKIIL